MAESEDIMEFTKGELKHGYDDGSGLDKITDDVKSVLAIRWGCSCCQDTSDLTEEENVFAKELVRRWNAFEKTKQQRNDLLEVCEDFVKGHESGAAMPLSWLIKKAKAAIAKCEA